MSRIVLKHVDLQGQKHRVWEIFKDSTSMFSDYAVKFAGHSVIDSADKLYDYFYWNLIVSSTSDYIGCYTHNDELIGLAYINNLSYYDISYPYKGFEGSFHGSMHPDYRKPSYTDECLTAAVKFFKYKHYLQWVFSYLREDNRPAIRALLRNGFELYKVHSHSREHDKVPVKYNVYLYGGYDGRF